MKSPIREMFNSLSNHNNQSYMANHISKKKYVDIKELKKEKLGLDWRIALKQKENKKQKPLNMKCTKGTFLEAIEKKQRRTPSPVTYSPHKYEPQYKKKKFEKLSERHTLFYDIEQKQKKLPIPGSWEYSETSNEKIKSKSLGTMSKAININYLDEQISRAARLPGVGSYNAHRQIYDKNLGKWNKSECKSVCDQKNSLPGVTDYSPKNTEMKLFANITKKKKNATFAKQKRWKDQKKVHKVPFYSKISEWGMKTNYEKKDILYKLSKSQANNSIYYQ